VLGVGEGNELKPNPARVYEHQHAGRIFTKPLSEGAIPPSEDYSYLLVEVEPGQNAKFTLNRLRPWSAKPFESVGLSDISKSGAPIDRSQ
jgi:hypothetical protein